MSHISYLALFLKFYKMEKHETEILTLRIQKVIFLKICIKKQRTSKYHQQPHRKYTREK